MIPSRRENICGLLILFFCRCVPVALLLFLAACSGVRPVRAVGNLTPERPIVLFWTDDVRGLANVTHITPSVWIRKSASDTGDMVSEQSYLLGRGITPLKWRGGKHYAERSEQELTDYWCGAYEEGYVGIAIDEFVGWDIDQSVNEKMGRALVAAKKRCPELFIVVWHGGPLTPMLAEFYRDGADLVLLEAYGGAVPVLWLLYSHYLAVARRAGIASKCLFALGINDRDEELQSKPWKRWANTPEELQAQINWVRENAPEMPGIAFFASRAGPEMIRAADRMAGEIYSR